MTVKAKRKLALLVAVSLGLCGCQSLNSRLGRDVADYSNARELPPLQLPATSMPVSKRYDIPKISNNKNTILADIAPPDYCKE